MHPTTHAAARPDHPAIIMAGSGQTVTFGEMDAAANRIANLFRAHGIGPGETVGLWLENRIEYLEIAWGNQRAGTTIVPISTHLTADEVAYMLDDCRDLAAADLERTEGIQALLLACLEDGQITTN